MARVFTLPWADVGSGIVPSDGAQMFFYDTGTYNERDTYPDAAESAPNANPVIADSNGVFPDIFISGDYRVVLRDKNDVLIREIDGVTYEFDDTSLQTQIDKKVDKNLAIPVGTLLKAGPDGTLAGLSDLEVLDLSWKLNEVRESTSSANPATIWGAGSFAVFAAGRVTMGAGTSTTDTNGETIVATAGTTRGEYRHTQTESEMPAHTHPTDRDDGNRFGVTSTTSLAGGNSVPAPDGATKSAGSGTPMNNEQPSIVVYKWERTA